MNLVTREHLLTLSYLQPRPDVSDRIPVTSSIQTLPAAGRTVALWSCSSLSKVTQPGKKLYPTVSRQTSIQPPQQELTSPLCKWMEKMQLQEKWLQTPYRWKVRVEPFYTKCLGVKVWAGSRLNSSAPTYPVVSVWLNPHFFLIVASWQERSSCLDTLK